MTDICVSHLSFSYPSMDGRISPRPALDDISFKVERGEFLLLCGASGSGKTTLLRLLKPEIAPRGSLTGSIEYFGGDADPDVSLRIGYVGQNPDASIVTDKVYHELAFGLESQGADNALMRRRVAELSHYFGISQYFRQDTATLSGGQKQILSLASVLATDPDILLLDEPTSQLDPVTASAFLSALHRLNRETGITVILSEHRLEDIFPICDRVLTVDKGRLITDAPPATAVRELYDSIMEPALPSASRIYRLLGGEGEPPLSVREGREWVENSFSPSGKSVDKTNAALDDGETDADSGSLAMSVSNIRFRYERGGEDVLRGVSLDIKKGSCTCILGGNGSGKSTLLSCMSGLETPFGGKVSVYCEGGKKKSPEQCLGRGIAYLPQDAADVFACDCIADDLYETLERVEPSMSKEEIRASVKTYTDGFGISELVGAHPYDLSGGELQRFAIIKSMLSKPSIFLLDEPTKGLDPLCKKELARILSELCKSGVAVVFVSHDVEFASDAADRCTMLFDGELTPPETPKEFFSNNLFYTTATSRILRNILPGAVKCKDAEGLIKK